MGQKLNKTSKDPYLREQFFKLKRKYRSTCRKEKRKFEQNILQKLETLQSSNNGDFWNFLKQMKCSNFDKQLSDEVLPPIQDLCKTIKNYYKKNITQK